MAQTKRSVDPGALAQVLHTVQLVWRLLIDPRVPALNKLIIPGILIYVLSPIDLVPDFIPVLGWLDDLVIVPLGLVAVRAMIPKAVLAEHRERLDAELNAP